MKKFLTKKVLITLISSLLILSVYNLGKKYGGKIANETAIEK
jgi:hypothetical protein